MLSLFSLASLAGPAPAVLFSALVFRFSELFFGESSWLIPSTRSAFILCPSKTAQVPLKLCGGFQPVRADFQPPLFVFPLPEFLPAPTTVAPGCVSGLGSSRQQA
jgi:hypothetical protein